MTAADDAAKRMYGVFSTSPLSVDQSDLYVDLEEVRGEYHVVNKLSRFIGFSPDKFTCQVLAGHKGCGKSTELMRLKAVLESDEYKYHVVLCDAFPNLDPNDVDFPDLLLEIVSQLAEDLRVRADINLKPGYFAELPARIGSALTQEIGIDSFELGHGDLGKITATIKNSPEARHKIRKALEPHTNSLLQSANDVIGEAVLRLSKKDRAGLVLLVDNLDKLIVRPMEGSNCDTAEYLFINRAPQMTALNCHVVYTIPISLAYSHQAQNVMSQYGGQLPFVPATKVSGPPPKSEPFGDGILKFRDIVDRRLKKAEVPFDEAFESEEVVRDLIMLSGGQPTELMTLVREAIISGGLPIKSNAVERTKREGRREYERMLLAEHMKIVHGIAKKGTFERTEKTEAAFRQLLNSRAVLQYVNEKEWYGLNPMVRELIAEKETKSK